MLHTADDITCPVLNQPDNYHFERRCEDCDTHTLARLNLGQAEDRHHTGRIGQDSFEAYMHVWAVLSPAGSHAEWLQTPTNETVRRIARKLFRARSLPVPADLATAARVQPPMDALAA